MYPEVTRGRARWNVSARPKCIADVNEWIQQVPPSSPACTSQQCTDHLKPKLRLPNEARKRHVLMRYARREQRNTLEMLCLPRTGEIVQRARTRARTLR
eukprot:9470071-Pyramimonas_sp.AAC.2